jgi:dolichyl-phosphate beta-glucosyltransferase
VDTWRARKELAKKKGEKVNRFIKPDNAEVFLSVVVPAYNEAERLGGMLEEAVDYLQKAYGDAHGPQVESKTPSVAAMKRKQKGHTAAASKEPTPQGWEILIVSDGSTDETVETALKFARDHQLSQYPVAVPGPWSADKQNSTHIPHGSIRVVTLEENRGKGGAVTHGMRHVRGKYAVFADADGASKFEDVEHLIRMCQECEDPDGRAVAIGSRAHLVGSEAVVKVCLAPLKYVVNTILTRHHPALRTPQLPDARIPPPHPPHDTSSHILHKRYTMWLQTFLEKLVTRYNTIYAFRGLDL